MAIAMRMRMSYWQVSAFVQLPRGWLFVSPSLVNNISILAEQSEVVVYCMCQLEESGAMIRCKLITARIGSIKHVPASWLNDLYSDSKCSACIIYKSVELKLSPAAIIL